MSAIVAGASVALSTLCVLATPVFAEAVEVKYQGIVDLEGYDCQSVTRSSLVHRVCYDDAKRQMIVELGSTYYAYCDIGSDAVDDLLAAKSMGRHYATTIKSSSNGGRYDCRP